MNVSMNRPCDHDHPSPKPSPSRGEGFPARTPLPTEGEAGALSFARRVRGKFLGQARVESRVVSVFAFALLLTGCHRAPPPATAAHPAVKVQTVIARTQRTPDVYDALGTVRARDSARVAAQVTAVIHKLSAKLGDSVKAGQVLAELEDRELRAEFDRARAEYNRFKILLEKQAATQAEFEAAEARYHVTEAALSHTRLLAPFDGLVTQKLVEPGDLALPGQTLFVLEKPGDFRLEVDVPERLIATLQAGQKTYVRIEATGEQCDGTISELGPAADPATRTVLVKIDLACRQALRSGVFGRAQLILGERFGMFVSKAAVHTRGQLSYVWVVVDGAAHLRLVRTGQTYLDGVELLSGVQDGEPVVVSATDEIQEGQPVAP